MTRVCDKAKATVAALGAVGLIVLAGPASEGRAHEADGRPARIHAGTCEDFRGVVYILTGVGAETAPGGTPAPQPEQVGAADAFPVALSKTTVPVALTDLAEGEHAIVVYESDEAMDRPVACGTVGGPLTSQMPGMTMPGDELAVWLAEKDSSGLAGVAVLEAKGRETIVRMYLGEGLGGAVRPDGGDDHASATPGA